MSQTSVPTETINIRETARAWLADVLRSHLHPELGGADRIRNVAASIEDEAHEKNMPIELAVSVAVEWCELQNDEAGLSHASQQ
jgi:hypothetical protein